MNFKFTHVHMGEGHSKQLPSHPGLVVHFHVNCARRKTLLSKGNMKARPMFARGSRKKQDLE